MESISSQRMMTQRYISIIKIKQYGRPKEKSIGIARKFIYQRLYTLGVNASNESVKVPLGEILDGIAPKVNQAVSTANSAKSEAAIATSTANDAKTTAENAKSLSLMLRVEPKLQPNLQKRQKHLQVREVPPDLMVSWIGHPSCWYRMEVLRLERSSLYVIVRSLRTRWTESIIIIGR